MVSGGWTSMVRWFGFLVAGGQIGGVQCVWRLCVYRCLWLSVYILASCVFVG